MPAQQTVATLLHFLLPLDLLNIILMQLIIAYHLMNNQSTCKSKLYRTNSTQVNFPSTVAQSSICDLHTQIQKFWNVPNLTFKEDSLCPFSSLFRQNKL